MRSFRTTWRLRGLAVLLAVSLLPMTVVVPSSTALPRAGDAQADWLRSHIEAASVEAASVEDEAAVEAALEAAANKPTSTLHDFLRVFANTYQQHAPDRSLGQLFGTPDLSGEALIHYLQQHVAQISGWATVPHRLTAAQGTTGTSVSLRVAGTLASLPDMTRIGLRSALSDGSRGQHVICALRTLFSAQPMGP